MKPLTIRFLSHDEAAHTENDKLVPAYRIRDGQRKFMAWAERNGRLRGRKRFDVFRMGLPRQQRSNILEQRLDHVLPSSK